MQAWGGAKTLFGLPTGPALRILMAFDNSAELSPDGIRIAADVLADQQTGATETLLLADGVQNLVTQSGSPQGWLDNTHLVVGSASDVWIFDTRSGDPVLMTGLTTIPQQGMPALAGVLPTNLT